jgi:predicted deacylase
VELKYFNFKYGKKEFDIPYYEFVGKKTGKAGFFASGLRGDDINSMNIIRNFIKAAKTINLESKISGILLVFPALNLPAVLNQTKNAFEDNFDLFKAFSGAHSSLTKSLAFELTNQFFKKCDYGTVFLDSHTEFDYLLNGKIYLHKGKPAIDFKEQSILGANYLFKVKATKSYMPVFLSQNYGTQVSVFEFGNYKNLRSVSLKPIITGLKNTLAYHNQLNLNYKIKSKQNILNSKSAEKARNAGILNLKINLGDKITKGQRVGIIFDPILQKDFPITATKSGEVYGIRNSNLIKVGEGIYYIN